VKLRGRSAEGRAARLRFDWRMAPVRTLLATDPIQTDGVTHDTGAPGTGGSVVDLSKVLGLEYPGSPLHWQVRTRSANPLFPHSPWLCPAWSGVNETDLRLAGAWSAVGGEPPPPDRLRITASPNPFQLETRIAFMAEIAGEVDVAVFDVLGRRVRSLHRGFVEPGSYVWTWDGRNDQGHPAVAGPYFIRVLDSGGPVAARVTRIY
jgi:hypothetical protein